MPSFLQPILAFLVLTLAPMESPAAEAQPGSATRGDLSLLDRSVFERRDLIYGSEIGAWDMNGGTAINNATARQNISAAAIPVIRWGLWAKFDFMDQGGSTPKQTLAQFNRTVDGIRSLGAIPFIKLPPIWPKQGDGAQDSWNIDWLKEIIKAAGSRVQLYEFANEPDWYQKWPAKTYSDHWSRVAPELKRYARSLGFEIFLGGPAMANSYPGNVQYIQEFLSATADAYRKSGNRDVVPDFVSSHTYLTEKENASPAAMQLRIDQWGEFYGQVRAAIDLAYAGLKDQSGTPLASQIKIADSEFNYTINNKNPRADDPAYVHYYLKAMYQMLRERNVWMANLFTIASHDGGAFDLLRTDGTPKPLYDAYKTLRTSDNER